MIPHANLILFSSMLLLALIANATPRGDNFTKSFYPGGHSTLGHRGALYSSVEGGISPYNSLEKSF